MSEAGTVKETSPSANEMDLMYESSPFIREIADRRFSNRRVIRFLLESGIVKIVDGNASVDAQAFDLINRFESFLLALVPERIKRQKSISSDDTPVSGNEPSSVPPSDPSKSNE